jgi:hypothetical protein
MATEQQKVAFWRTLLIAAEVEPREATTIRGASGFSHPIVSVGVDEARKRVVIISGESDARSAALAHGDIQAAMPSLRVLMIRPIAINLGGLARSVSEIAGRTSLSQADLDWLVEVCKRPKQELDAIVTKMALQMIPHGLAAPWIASLNVLAVWKEIVQQLALIDIETPTTAGGQGGKVGHGTQIPTLHFTRLLGFDPAEADRGLGVCAVPLYGFSAADVEVFHAGRDIDAARNILGRHGILQYFFPSADQLALGFAEQLTAQPGDIVDRLIQTPGAGHPFGALEIVDPQVRLTDMVGALQEFGLLVEGEAGVEVTEKGRTVRAAVRFKPREALLTRLANVLSVKLDLSLKDLFRK